MSSKVDSERGIRKKVHGYESCFYRYECVKNIVITTPKLTENIFVFHADG